MLRVVLSVVLRVVLSVVLSVVFGVVFSLVFSVEASSPFSGECSAFSGTVNRKRSVKYRVSESSPVLALPRRGRENLWKFSLR